MEQKPSVGRIVLYRQAMEPGQESNQFPAIVTRVWTATCVNLTIFPDNAAPYCRTSALHEQQTNGGLPCWSWPSRV